MMRLKPVWFNEEALDDIVDIIMSIHGAIVKRTRGLANADSRNRDKVEAAIASICSIHVERFNDLNDQAVAIACRLAQDHCYPDGNKRTAIITAMAIMEAYGRAIHCTDADIVNAGLKAAIGDADGVRRALLSRV